MIKDICVDGGCMDELMCQIACVECRRGYQMVWEIIWNKTRKMKNGIHIRQLEHRFLLLLASSLAFLSRRCQSLSNGQYCNIMDSTPTGIIHDGDDGNASLISTDNGFRLQSQRIWSVRVFDTSYIDSRLRASHCRWWHSSWYMTSWVFLVQLMLHVIEWYTARGGAAAAATATTTIIIALSNMLMMAKSTISISSTHSTIALVDTTWHCASGAKCGVSNIYALYLDETLYLSYSFIQCHIMDGDVPNDIGNRLIFLYTY